MMTTVDVTMEKPQMVMSQTQNKSQKKKMQFHESANNQQRNHFIASSLAVFVGQSN